jgi:hypothetical protein
MQFAAKRPEVQTGIEARPDEDARAARDEVGDRQAAALCLQAAAETQDAARRASLRRRAAELVSSHPGGRVADPPPHLSQP